VHGCQEQTSKVLLRVSARRGRADARPAIKPCAKPAAHPVDAQLEKAARAPQTGELVELVRAGVPVGSRDQHGRTPLHLVAAHSYLKDELRLLLKRKPDSNAKDDEGMTPLHLAAEDASAEMSRLLLAAGSDPNAADARGRTPLHLVPYRDDVHELTALLIDNGANPGTTDRLGRTALHAMSDSKAEDRARAELLVCHGAAPGARDHLGWTASDLAAIRGWPDASPARCGDAWQKLMQRNSVDPNRPRLGY
jgi:cytohesin